MMNKKTILFSALLLIFLLGVTAVSATDADSTVDTSAIDATSSIQTDNIQEISEVNTDTSVASSDDTISEKTVKTDVQENDKLAEPKTIVITNDTFSNYFTNKCLNDNVTAGDTLDFQGFFYGEQFEMNISKPVNIISSTKDAYIELNSTGGSLTGEDPVVQFQISNGGSYTNMTGIYFFNSQFIVRNATHVNIENCSMVVKDRRVGSGIGQTTFRENVTDSTLKNCFIYTENNGGSSSMVFTWADNCTVDNCTIQGEGNVGNLFYLNTYNLYVDVPEGVIINSNNVFKNNRILGPSTASGTCNGITLGGHNNSVINNTVNTRGAGVTTAWGGSFANASVIGNTLSGGCSLSAGNTIINNTVLDGGKLTPTANATVIGNTAPAATVSSNIIFADNTITGTLTVTNANSTISGNTLGALTLNNANSKNNVIADNTINGQVQFTKGSNNTFTRNTVVTDTEYAVTVASASTNNTIADNKLSSASHSGDEAVSVSGTTNVVEDNKAIVVYYVSDSRGSDENDGSQTTPFKSIGKAIESTTADSAYVINIEEGTYKGADNTNLTVNGAYDIEFIGAGINKTVADGEATYTIVSGGFNWGATEPWWSWNGNGNWFMNITNGSGDIKIKNLTIQNMWSTGGSSIAAYPTSPVYNHATLTVSDVYFFANRAGVGTLRNYENSTLYVYNCIFDNNTKSSSTGNDGVLYNNGTAYIYDSEFINNWARWGTVTNDKTLFIYNSVFKNNTGYDGSSTYKNGPGIYSNTGSADFYSPYEVLGLYTEVQGCTFINNDQCDINLGKGRSIVNNCVFNNSTGIVIASNTAVNMSVVQEITNNEFINMQPSALFTSMSSTTKPSWGVYSLASYNITIENNTIDVPDSTYGYGIYVKGNTTVINNTVNNYIYLNGNGNTILNNTVNTTRDYAVQSVSSGKDNVIANNTLYSSSAMGDLAVSVSANNVVSDNLPKVYTYIVTDDNYSTYFDETGVIKADTVSNGSQMLLSGELNNKNFIFDNVKLIVGNNDSAVINNGTIVTQNNAIITFVNIKMNNTNSDKKHMILLNSSGNKISDSTIYAYTPNPIHAIELLGDNNIVTNVNVNITGPSNGISYVSYPNPDFGDNIGIFIASNDNLINNSRVNVSAINEGAEYGSIYGIVLASKESGVILTGNEMKNVRVNATGKKYAYALDMARAENTTTSMIWLNATSDFYAYAIQITGPVSNSEIAGYLYSKAPTAYGVYATTWSGAVDNVSFAKLYLQAIEADTAYGFALEGASNILLSNATYSLVGKDVTAVSVTNGNNITVWANKMNTTTDGQNTAIINIVDSNNVNITANNITTGVNAGIVLNNTGNSSVTYNNIIVNMVIGGNDAVTQVTQTDNVVEYNTPTIVVITDDNYSTYFDENGVFKLEDAQIITIASDLYNKDLIFNSLSKTNITTNNNYTIYNGTITLNNIGGDLRIKGVNFNNTDKPVLVNNISTSTQRNIYFNESTIYLTGDDVTAFKSNNDDSLVYIDIKYVNLTADAKNVTVVDFVSPVINSGVIYFDYNNINITAEDSAYVIKHINGTGEFKYNNVTMNAVNTAVAINAYAAAYTSSSRISYNNFEGSADTIMAINLTSRYGTTTTSFTYNNITFTSANPVIAFNITNVTRTTVERNNFYINATNGETPVVDMGFNPYTSTSTTYYNKVQNNYIEAKDVMGNDAATGENKITISSNTPSIHATEMEATVAEEVSVKDTTNITVDVTNIFGDSVEGKFTLTIDGEVVDEIESSNVTFEYTPETTGEKTYVISYVDPNGKIESQSQTGTINVVQRVTTITMDSASAQVFEEITVVAKVVDDKNLTVNEGTVTFTAKGETTTVDVVDGEASIKVSYDESGVYEVSASYTGTEVYTDAETIVANLTVGKVEVDITVVPLTPINYGQDTTMTIVLSSENGVLADKELTISYGDVVDTVTTNKHGIATYDLKDLTANDYEITVSYAGDTSYLPNEVTTTLTVNKLTSTVSIDSIITQVDNIETVTVNVKSAGKAIDEGSVEIIVNGESVATVEVSAGVATSDVNFTISGKNNVTAKFLGSENYLPSEASIKATVTKYDVEVNANDVVGTVNTDIPLEVTVTNDEGLTVNDGVVIVTIKGAEVARANVVECTANIVLNLADEHSGIVKITFTDSNKFNNAVTYVFAEVNQYETELVLDAISGRVGDSITIKATVTDEEGNLVNTGNVEFTDGKDLNVTVSVTGGVASTEYVIPITWTEDTVIIAEYIDPAMVYVTSIATTVPDVSKTSVSVTVDDVTEMVLNEVSIVANVVDEFGNAVNDGSVEFSIDGELVATVDVTEGVAEYTFTAKQSDIAESTVSTTYKGNDIYADSEAVESSLTITTRPTVTTMLEVVGQVGSEVTLRVTVVDCDGNAFTGGRVGFKVNGNTLKDADGNIIHVNVVDGTATYTMTVDKNLVGDSTIIAIFGGNKIYATSRSDEVSMTIEKQDVSVLIAPVTAKVGDTITLTAYVVDSNGNAFTGGRVAFSTNKGVVTGNNGNTHTNVVDGFVMLTFTVPDTWVDSVTTIYATFGGNKYYNGVKSEKVAVTITE